MQLSIAVVQFEIEQFAPERNLAKAERYISGAAAQGADIIVFPEDFITGPLFARRELADSEQKYARHFQQLAATYKIDIVSGSIIERDGDGLHNTAYYIDHTGKILGRYRKVNLWLTERCYLKAGQTPVVCSTRFGKIGLAICWDLAFPELFRAMIAQQGEIVICPSYWSYEDAGPGLRHDGESEAKFVDALCTCRAFEQQIILVYANGAGELNTEGARGTLIGRSQVTAPFKGPLQHCAHNRETMFIQPVDTAILADAEVAYEIRADMKKENFSVRCS